MEEYKDDEVVAINAPAPLSISARELVVLVTALKYLIGEVSLMKEVGESLDILGDAKSTLAHINEYIGED